MLDNRSLIIGGIAGFSVALLGVGFFGCQKKKDKNTGDTVVSSTPSPAGPAQSADELGTPLATVDEVVITVGEFQERINRQSPYIRARYTSLEQKREFLDTLIRFEVLAKEATRRGFDKDPEVVRTMKQVMIQKLMKDEFEDKMTPEDISEEELKAFYESHKDEYNKPEEVRVSAIILKSKAEAEKVVKLAQTEEGSSNKAFRELVGTHSTDEKTKIRGGDLRYFAADTTEVPKPVVEAAFKLARTGDVAGPIDAGDGTFYVIKQTGKRKAVTKQYEDVKRQIQNRLYRDKRTEAQRVFIDGLEGKAKITVFDDGLKKVRIDTTTQSSVPAHGMPPGAPAFPGAEATPGHSE